MKKRQCSQSPLAPLVLAAGLTGLAGLAGTASAQTAKDPTKVQVQWLGQAAFRITGVAGKVIVIDPWLISSPKALEAFRRLDALGKVDLVLASQGRFAHLADAPALAKLNNAPLWAASRPAT